MKPLHHLSIKSKLIIMLLEVSGCSILLTAYLGYQSGRANLTDRALSQLTSLRSSKSYQIESYFKTLRNHTQTLSTDLTIVEAIGQFDRAYQQLEQTQLSPLADQQLQQYYSNEFIARLAKTEQGTPVLSAFLPQKSAARYLQHRYLAANSHPAGKKHLLDDPKDGSDYSRLHARFHPMFREIRDLQIIIDPLT
jgi:hypothetical protein